MAFCYTYTEEITTMRAKFKRNGMSRNRDGWSKAEYDVTTEKQQGLCAICRQPMESPCKDHSHEEPPVPRGLLCRQCNFGLGHFGDSVSVLISAIQYLQYHTKEVDTRRPVLAKHGDYLEDADGVRIDDTSVR